MGETRWPLVRLRNGNTAPENFQALEEVLPTLINEG